MTVCEAMTVAMVARTAAGIIAQSGTRSKEGWPMSPGVRRSRPTYPR